MAGNPENKRVFLDITVNGRTLGRIVIELFCSIAPCTAENFRALCVGDVGMAVDGRTRLSYRGVSIHRVVKQFMIQGGDISGKDGRGGFSIYGEHFDDEPFIETHKKYMVSMANKGPNTNSSQFFITTSDAQHCDGKHVVFGKVVRGTDVVDAIEKIRTDKDDKPMMDIMISSCGELFRKPKTNINKEKDTSNAPIEEAAEESEDPESTEYIPEAPKNWLYRPDKKEEEQEEVGNKEKKRDRGDRKSEKKRHKHRHKHRHHRHRSESRNRTRSRSRSRGRERKENPIREDADGNRIRGRGSVLYKGFRSSTPEHWRANAPTRKYIQNNVSEKNE